MEYTWPNYLWELGTKYMEYSTRQTHHIILLENYQDSNHSHKPTPHVAVREATQHSGAPLSALQMHDELLG